MRVPPDQSSTAASRAASASSGSRARRLRVTLVSRVADRTCRARLRASVTAMQELQEQPRVVAHRAGDIEQRHDRRRLVDARAECRFTMSPPVRSCPAVRRRSRRCPLASA